MIRSVRVFKGGGGLRFASLFVSLAILGAPFAAAEGADPAVATVDHFLGLLKTDKALAEAMLAEDAQMGAGDVGGAMTLSVFDEFPPECRFDTSQAHVEPVEMPGREIAIVGVALRCGSGDALRSNKVQFLVEDGKIAGLYIPSGRRDTAE